MSTSSPTPTSSPHLIAQGLPPSNSGSGSKHGDMVTHGFGTSQMRFLAETETWIETQKHELACQHESGLNPAQPGSADSPACPFTPERGTARREHGGQPKPETSTHIINSMTENDAESAISTGVPEAVTTNATANATSTDDAQAVTSTTARPPAVINLGHRKRSGGGKRQAKVRVASNPATVPSSLGIPWSLATTSIDNSKSPKLGIALRRAMEAQGIADFQCGDLVRIEIGRGPNRYQLVGRASRPSTSYFWTDELSLAETSVHDCIEVIILDVERVSESTNAEEAAR